MDPFACGRAASLEAKTAHRPSDERLTMSTPAALVPLVACETRTVSPGSSADAGTASSTAAIVAISAIRRKPRH